MCFLRRYSPYIRTNPNPNTSQPIHERCHCLQSSTRTRTCLDIPDTVIPESTTRRLCRLKHPPNTHNNTVQYLYRITRARQHNRPNKLYAFHPQAYPQEMWITNCQQAGRTKPARPAGVLRNRTSAFDHRVQPSPSTYAGQSSMCSTGCHGDQEVSNCTCSSALSRLMSTVSATPVSASSSRKLPSSARSSSCPLSKYH